MNVYKELSEIEDLRDTHTKLTDNLLDLYKKNPDECTKLLNELNSLYEELDDLEKQFENIKNEIC